MPREIRETKRHADSRRAQKPAKTAPAATTPGMSLLEPTSASLNRDVFELTVNPAPRAAEAIELRSLATTLIITDKTSHTEGLRRLKAGKAIVRDIKVHWTTLKRPVSDLLAHIRNLEAGEVEPGDVGVREIERKVSLFERAEQDRIDAANRENRERADEDARTARLKELAAAEAAALEAEAAMEGLSARETAFVEAVADMRYHDPVAAARQARYADPYAAATRLMKTAKILKAIDGIQSAALIRQQAAAREQQPIVATVEDEKPELGKVAGLSKRTYYSCDQADVKALLEAYKAGTLTETSAFLSNLPFLNKEAGRIKDPAIFERVYPGCTMTSRDGHAG